jgi:hypothetical protein
MDDFNNPVFAQAKIEYTKQLTDVLVSPMYEGLKRVYEQSKRDYANDTNKSFHNVFRNNIEVVPKWNADMIETEVERIEKSSNCDWLDDLITAVFISHTKILASIGNKTKKINLTIPKTDNFVHKCYINSAREIWKNPYLFDENKSSIEYQRNIKYTEDLIKESVEQTIRKLLPVKNILREHLENTDSVKREESSETGDVQKMLMKELMDLKNRDRERFTLSSEDERYFDDHVDEEAIRNNTKNIKIHNILEEPKQVIERYDNVDIVSPSVDESVVSTEEKLDNYKNIITENRDRVIEPAIPEVPIVPVVPEPQTEPQPEPEMKPLITHASELISDDTKNIKTNTEIERIVEEPEIKTVTTIPEGRGKVETVEEDDKMTIDNFMDDMNNMLKDNNKTEFSLFDDVG